jgi:hypothetical protein
MQLDSKLTCFVPPDCSFRVELSAKEKLIVSCSKTGDGQMRLPIQIINFLSIGFFAVILLTALPVRIDKRQQGGSGGIREQKAGSGKNS